MTYEQQRKKDKPVVNAWHEAMEKEIAARQVKHFGHNMETLCDAHDRHQLTTVLMDVTCEKCLTILSGLVELECLPLWFSKRRRKC